MQRVVGVDVTRGLAVLGMFAAHLGGASEDFWTPTGWLQVADGRPSAGFALLAGLSAALLSGGPHPPSSLRRARTRILVRAVLIGVIGLLLELLGTPVAVILPTYAVLFAVITTALRWSRTALLGTAGVVLLIGPPVVQLARTAGLPSTSYLADILVGEYYPALVWVAYLLVGLAVGRSDLRAAVVRRTLLAVGAAGAVLGYGTSALVLRTVEEPVLRALLTAEPHAATATEVVGNTGVVLVVLVAVLVLAERAPALVTPVAATGALALTAYCGHLVAIAAWGPEVVYDARTGVLVAFVLVTLVLTTLWRRRWGRGPLERLLHEVSAAVADIVVPAPRQHAVDATR